MFSLRQMGQNIPLVLGCREDVVGVSQPFGQSIRLGKQRRQRAWGNARIIAHQRRDIVACNQIVVERKDASNHRRGIIRNFEETRAALRKAGVGIKPVAGNHFQQLITEFQVTGPTYSMSTD